MTKRILIVGPPKSGKLTLVKALTSSLPSDLLPTNTSHAGLSHTLPIKTPYYSADVPIWVDEFTPGKEDEWVDGYCSEEAREVLDVLGAIIVTFRHGEDMRDCMKGTKAAERIVERCGGEYGVWNGVCVAVGMHKSVEGVDEGKCEEACTDAGFEYVDFAATGRNEYGEQTGLARIREALEANDWNDEHTIDENDLDGEGPIAEIGDDFGTSEFDEEFFDMSREMAGLREALAQSSIPQEDKDNEEENNDGLDDDEVEGLEKMMGALLAAREQGKDLPLAERRELAAQTVGQLMKKM
ncbi:hypothetical protein SAICODRAFT_6138 [Saitoella complicata NRRL Y-17804]|uniref:Increased recombination centers protein 6 n=1 Tax=Saitoella complicata (strain BCRC 22490 / CBS 7301 / JCM 7358 / NBRC 10748 / NRRL Y-17804) TaxID=698492 RepID=A0A0E9N7M6_SAICN|nr:uncharacterized protein SAICODRAFT_6138 [Saitoella complicata NRRL Y-17804]ODQ54380.1 hypothetical protein SAICODRAFT_6138 [Saitoella complicata NRRL Y-17804]GAO45839.1 hypothetical protein G7K_0088-t1 [Saitoella complicata NRRL Y-17804]